LYIFYHTILKIVPKNYILRKKVTFYGNFLSNTNTIALDSFLLFSCNVMCKNLFHLFYYMRHVTAKYYKCHFLNFSGERTNLFSWKLSLQKFYKNYCNKDMSNKLLQKILINFAFFKIVLKYNIVKISKCLNINKNTNCTIGLAIFWVALLFFLCL